MQVQLASYKTINTNNEKGLFVFETYGACMANHHFTLQHEHCIYHVC
jgi:hypothetical protein